MKRTLLCTTNLIALLFLGGCGGSDSPGDTPPGPGPEPVGMLVRVTDPADLERSIKTGFTSLVQGAQDTALNAGAGEISGAGVDSAGGFTGTYTQEPDVDEFDAVRYDGTHLYVAPRRYFDCCYILAEASGDGAVPAGPDPAGSIRILRTDPDTGTAELAGSIPLDDRTSVQGMYLAEDRMFALTARAYYGTYGPFWTDLSIWAPEQLGYRVYDVSDPAAPVLQVDASIDGIFVDSRRVGDTVYIVSRYAPNVDGLDYTVQTVAEGLSNQALLAGVSLADLLPKITINGRTESLVDPTRCYVPRSPTGRGYAVITSVTAVPIDDPASFTTTCYNEDAYGIYVSANAVYFTQVLEELLPERTITRIHKFSLAGTLLDYRGSADVEGQVWRGGHADFRMNEFGGDLRLLASSYDWASPDFVDHKLHILREHPTRPELEVVSSLPNAARPEEIGKPNESLFGVRFFGERAYAVTFRQVDPLYVIDLSDPADPRLAGELTVTGFSDFLHPVTDGLLLGLGQAAGGGLKLELFDVSSLARPISRGAIELGQRGIYSEASYDRHAFTYQADVGGIDRVAIPASGYETDGTAERFVTALHLFEIRDKATPALASLIGVGAMTPPNDSPESAFAQRNRSFIHGDTVYYVADERIWSAQWNAPTLLNGPF